MNQLVMKSQSGQRVKELNLVPQRSLNKSEHKNRIRSLHHSVQVSICPSENLFNVKIFLPFCGLVATLSPWKQGLLPLHWNQWSAIRRIVKSSWDFSESTESCHCPTIFSNIFEFVEFHCLFVFSFTQVGVDEFWKVTWIQRLAGWLDHGD